MAAQSSLYNEDRNLLRIREKERRNQEAHQEKEAFPEKTPLFGEPYKTEKGDELSSRIQNMLGNYEEVKEFLSTKSHPNRFDASENRLGKPRYSLFPEKGSSIPPHSFHASAQHQPMNTPSTGPLPIGNISHNPKMAQPRMEPMPSLHTKSYGPLDGQHLTQDHLGQQGFGSSHHKKGDCRADADQCASMIGSVPEREISPLLSSLPSPVPPLSPIHSNQQTLPRMQGSNKVHHGNNNSKGYCPAKSPKDLAVKIHDKETPQDSLVAVASLGVAPPQASSQTFPPPSLPSKSIAMQQKPTAYVRPMDGQDQAPSESPELKPLPEDYRQRAFEKTDLKVPAKAKLTKLKMPSQSVEQTYSNEVHCVEEILKEMTHSWPPPLTAIHTPSTAEPSKFPFPTKDSQHISSAIQNQKQYDTSSKTHPQQGTSTLEDDLQLSDSEDSDNEQAPEKPPSSPAPPSAPQSLPEPVASAHCSSAESESTSDSDSSSDSESESSSSDSEENEPPETPAPEPEPPTTNKWQLDNWLTKVGQPAVPQEGLSSTEAPLLHQAGKGNSNGSSTTGHEHSESKDPPPKNPSRAPRAPSEGPHPGKRSCQKSPAQQEPPQRQTVGTKQPKKPIKASAQVDLRASLQVESEPGLLPYGSKDQTSKDKPKVKTKGRPRAGESREPRPAVPTPSDRKKHKSSPQPPSKALSGPEPTKDNVEDRSPEHFALVPLTQGQGPPHSGSGSRTSGCRQAVVVQEDRRKDKFPLPLRDTKLLSPLRDAPPPQSLMVKITLDLLSRIPQISGKGSRPKKSVDKQPPAGKKQDSEKRSSDNSSKLAKKRKGEVERDHESKKIRLEKETKSQPSSSSSSSHKESTKTKTPRPSSEPSKKEMLPPPPVPSSSSSSQKAAKPAHRRLKREADTSPKSASSTKSNHKDSSISKHRKVEGKGSGSSTEHKGSAGDITNPFPVPSLPNGNSKPGKPQAKFDKQAEFHMKEAKKLKQKAESMTDKVGKAFKYLEAVLFFIECGIATESESPTSKSAYSVYSETVDLIKSIMSLKPFSDATTPTQEKIFAVLCMRCQSILNMALFRCKKDTAIKYSRTLNEHFKSSSKFAQAPSPCIARSTGTPSPLSPMPSPASSGGSQSSAGSVGSSGMAATISTPVTIHNMTSSYVTITSHVLTAFDLWEQAEVLTRKNKDFFAQLSTSVCALSLNSSLMDLVHYTRQGFQRLKQITKTP